MIGRYGVCNTSSCGSDELPNRLWAGGIMRRRLPFEPEHLVKALTSWIEWRYAQSRRRLVLTSAPTSLPPDLESWMPNAVWRLAWQGNGAAVLYGLAPRSIPRQYNVIRHDASATRTEGFF